jgi:hypothetical protein
MKKVEKKKINVGEQLYGIPTEGSNPFNISMFHDSNGKKKPSMGTVIGYDEVTKKYAVEWAAGADSCESYESETFVRSAIFSMNVIKEAMGMNLPQENSDE